MNNILTQRRGVSVFADTDEQERMELEFRARTKWGDWLYEYPWDHFGTFGFRSPRYAFEDVREGFRKFVSRIQQRTGCKIGWYWVCEKHLSGALHIHALLQRTANLTPSDIEDAWSNPKLHGNHYDRSLVEKYDPSKAGTHYITKDVAVRGADYDVSNTWWGVDGKPIEPTYYDHSSN